MGGEQEEETMQEKGMIGLDERISAVLDSMATEVQSFWPLHVVF